MLFSSTFSLITTIFLLSNILTPSAAEGINCHGSGACEWFGLDVPNGPQWLQKYTLGQANASTTYPPGYVIGCNMPWSNAALCLFTQNTAKNYTVTDLKVVLQDLVDHGCGFCGSAPLIRGPIDPQTGKPPNDISTGILTANIVHNPPCKGLCPAPGTPGAKPVRRRAREWSA